MNNRIRLVELVDKVVVVVPVEQVCELGECISKLPEVHQITLPIVSFGRILAKRIINAIKVAGCKTSSKKRGAISEIQQPR